MDPGRVVIRENNKTHTWLCMVSTGLGCNNVNVPWTSAATSDLPSVTVLPAVFAVCVLCIVRGSSFCPGRFREASCSFCACCDSRAVKVRVRYYFTFALGRLPQVFRVPTDARG